jgi:hypothetical protein
MAEEIKEKLDQVDEEEVEEATKKGCPFSLIVLMVIIIIVIVYLNNKKEEVESEA